LRKVFVSIVESMLESNPDDIDVNRKNFRQESALILAAKNSHTSSLSFLYSLKNIDPFITDGKGNTALHFMAIKNDKNVVDIILNQYVSIAVLSLFRKNTFMLADKHAKVARNEQNLFFPTRYFVIPKMWQI